MQIHSPAMLPTHDRLAELDRLGDEIAELSAHLDAATARLLDLIREFDAREGWGNGFRTCAHGCPGEWGSTWVLRARGSGGSALGTLPLLAGPRPRRALVRQGPALTRVATPDTEERLLAVGRSGTAEHVERIVRGWRRMDRKAEAQETTRQHKSRALHVYQDEDGIVVVRGRLAPEVGALLMQALAAGRETLYRQARADARPHRLDGRVRGTAHSGPAAGRRAGPARGDGPSSRARSRRPRRALPGGGACRRLHPRRPGSARPVGPRGRGARFRGNVAAAGVRREPGGDATRRGRAPAGGRGADPDDSSRVTAGAPPPRPRLPLPGMRRPTRPGPSHPSLGPRGAHHALEPRSALSPAPSRGP